MKIPENIKEVLLNADGKALGTSSYGKINVVPISTIKIVDDIIWLINYFMDKTLENILVNPEVSLTCWKKLVGYQIKAKVKYISDPNDNDLIQAKNFVAEILPDRIVKGLLILEPEEIFDISADAERAGKKIN